MIIGAILGMASPIFAVELTEGMEEVLTTSQLPTTPLVTVIGNVIKWVLGFLGLIATIIIIIGGFQWMSSGGNQEKIDKAKKLMINGLIGLIIVVLAYSISWFIIRAIEENIGPGEEGGGWGEEGPGNHYQLRGANYLVITSRSPKAGETVAQNTKVIVSFNQKLKNARVYYVNNEILNLGVIERRTNIGNLVRLYSAERTLCDFIKNKSNMDPEVYIKLVKTYPSFPDRDIHKLFHIAQQMDIAQKVQEIMELVYK